MVRMIIQSVLRAAGLQITRVPKKGFESSCRLRTKRRYRDEIFRDPLNPQLHLRYAIEASKSRMPHLAYAELKTAEFLGAYPEEVKEYEAVFRAALPDPEYMNHNQYFRFFSLASEIVRRSAVADMSILDVGGGEGELASFVSKARYCLAEPDVNGISGTALPFADRSFDYVVCCHVLEHIPVDDRARFLDQLLDKAKYGLILLNPFYVEGSHVDERLQLVIDITGAQWAKEHLHCSLPRVVDIREYADKRGLQISVEPNGTLATSLSFVFADYFATRSGLNDDWKKVNAFFNRNCIDMLHSADFPNAYLVHLSRGDNAISR